MHVSIGHPIARGRGCSVATPCLRSFCSYAELTKRVEVRQTNSLTPGSNKNGRVAQCVYCPRTRRLPGVCLRLRGVAVIHSYLIRWQADFVQ